MGKHAADLNLKTEEGRRQFEELLADVDVVVDGYRPDALEKLGYGPNALASLAEKRGKGIVYVNENCFGYEGEWASRPGWQQIADCVSQPNYNFSYDADTSIGNRNCLGPRPIYGPLHPRRPTVPNFRLWNRVHGCYRCFDRFIPPREDRRLVPRKIVPDAL